MRRTDGLFNVWNSAHADLERIMIKQRHAMSTSLLCALALSLLGIQDVPKAVKPPTNFEGKTAYRVVEVVSGDTFVADMDGSNVRVGLYIAHAPRTTDPYGKVAKSFLSNLLLSERVYLDFGTGVPAPSDPQVQRPAYVYRAPDGLFVNAEAIRQGYAAIYRLHQSPYAELFGEYEVRAKEAQKGIWADRSTEMPDETAKPTKKVSEKPSRANLNHRRRASQPSRRRTTLLFT